MATSEKTPEKSKIPADEGGSFGDNIRLSDDAQRLFVRAGTVGAIAWAVSLFLGIAADDSLKQFLHSYLTAFMWMLSIGIGALWWVTLQHLVNARWSVVVRRVGELLAANMTLLAVLALPIVIPIVFGNASLYVWADAERVVADHLLQHKAPYLNAGFFAVRFILYFAFWAALSRYFFNHSVQQDESGDPEHARRMARVSAPCMILLALTLTFAAFDFLMSLDPYWFSTIFGLYFFAGCVVSWYAIFALSLVYLQARGRLVRLVSLEHYHDIGKMLFAFVIFWSYIGFSQFMLQWYANIPEETAWWKERLAGDWMFISAALLFGHFIIPFFFLLSRYIKRNKTALAVGACWILAIHYIDMYWLVMPNLHHEHLSPSLLDVTCLIGIAGLFIASTAFQARRVNLIPTKDPRLAQSLAFENI